jgi:hypothetical protein
MPALGRAEISELEAMSRQLGCWSSSDDDAASVSGDEQEELDEQTGAAAEAGGKRCRCGARDHLRINHSRCPMFGSGKESASDRAKRRRAQRWRFADKQTERRRVRTAMQRNRAGRSPEVRAHAAARNAVYRATAAAHKPLETLRDDIAELAEVVEEEGPGYAVHTGRARELLAKRAVLKQRVCVKRRRDARAYGVRMAARAAARRAGAGEGAAADAAGGAAQTGEASGGGRHFGVGLAAQVWVAVGGWVLTPWGWLSRPLRGRLPFWQQAAEK